MRIDFLFLINVVKTKRVRLVIFLKVSLIISRGHFSLYPGLFKCDDSTTFERDLSETKTRGGNGVS